MVLWRDLACVRIQHQVDGGGMQSTDTQVDTMLAPSFPLWQLPAILELWGKDTNGATKDMESLKIVVVDRLKASKMFQW